MSHELFSFFVLPLFRHQFSGMLLMVFQLILARYASSAPTGAVWHGQPTTTWESEPNIRGSFRLISSCVITLTLCVWTAIHLNIPAKITQPDTRHRRQRIWSNRYVRRFRWVLMGLFAPELVVYTAWRQYTSAKILTTKVRDIIEKVSVSG
jgi:hypothetical protein